MSVCVRGLVAGSRALHTTAVTNGKWRYKMMDGTPIMPKRKRAEIDLMRPNAEACKRFWWKEDGTIWHWPREDHGYFRYARYTQHIIQCTY